VTALIDTRSVQRALATAGFYRGEIDGDYGPASKAAARARVGEALTGNPAKLKLGLWPDARIRVAVEQIMMRDLGFYTGAVDGISGPATQAGLEKWQDHLTFHVDSPNPAAGVPKAVVWPRQAEVERFFGKPGENQVRLKTPYPLYLDWALSEKLSGFQCHEKIHDAALRVLKRVLEHYGEAKIHELGLDQFGGCLNVRKMRNGSAWSMHAWGIAIDWDADRNQLRETSRTARMARPEYAPFLDLWEEEGFISLGRARNFDWMHVQAARL
jgi:hypothetical protein